MHRPGQARGGQDLPGGCFLPGPGRTPQRGFGRARRRSTPARGLPMFPLMKKPATRLDAVVKLRERDEDKARLELADAQRKTAAAEAELRTAEEKARRDERASGTAALWLMADAAHARALVEARQAERVVRTAHEQLGASRQRFSSAHARAEAMRRVAETRRAEIISEADAKERKGQDEMAMLLYMRSA